MKLTGVLIRMWAGAVMVLLAGTARSGEVDAAAGAGSRASVTIPYMELASLLDATRRERNAEATKPPVKSAVISADYELLLKGEQAVLAAEYIVKSFVADWQAIPLLGGAARLEQVEAGEGSVLRREGTYQLLTKGEGEFKAKLRFAVSPPGGWVGESRLRLQPGSAALNRLRIKGVPEGKSVRVQGLAPTELLDGEFLYHLPGEQCELLLSYEALGILGPVLPSQWNIQSEVFVSYGKGRLRYEARVHCQATEGSGMSIDLLLPSNAQSVKFEGDDLLDGRLRRSRDGERLLHLDWRTREIQDRVVEVSYEVSQSPLLDDWVLQAPKVSGAGSSASLFAILPVEGLEFAGTSLKGSVQSRRLPEWLQGRIGRSDFVTAESGAEYALKATWLPRVETAQARVSLAEFDTRLVGDGSLLVEGVYAIEHRSPLSWRLTLPAVEEVLSCEINGGPVRPVRRGTNEIEFALSPSTNGSSRVTFSYAAQLEAMDPVSGRLELSLPRTDLFIDQLSWHLNIPALYEPKAIEGNVTIDASPGKGGSDGAGATIRLKKELVRGEFPAAEVYYQRRGLAE